MAATLMSLRRTKSVFDAAPLRMDALLAYQGPLRHVDHAHRVPPTGFTPVEHAGKIHNLYAKGEEVVYTHAGRAPNGIKATVLKVYDLDRNGLPDGYYVQLANGQMVDTSEEHLAPSVHAATRVPTPVAPVAPVEPVVVKAGKKQAYAIVLRHSRRRSVCVKH